MTEFGVRCMEQLGLGLGKRGRVFWNVSSKAWIVLRRGRQSTCLIAGNLLNMAERAWLCPLGVSIESHSDMSSMVKLNLWGDIRKVSELQQFSTHHFKNFRFHSDSP